ncbi:TetR/AcrR family transcriptional regulator [Tardibacter chloracetimidivorans]|nr:TetR/AcrR family transcriptional regulator [Tardibacter chloracetimidivorans]
MINDESDSEGRSGRLAPAKVRPPKRGSKAGDEQPPRRVRSPRLTSGARKALILEGAMRFFAENGFSGTIRDLASFMGVSSPLIFRYFRTKEDLITAAVETLYVQKIDSEWINMLSDRSVSIEQRLKRFYRSYILVSDDYRWIRVAVGAGLANFPVMKEYLNSFMTPIFDRIAKELHFARTGEEMEKVSQEDRELLWHLHSSLVYLLIRKHIYRSTVTGNTVGHMDRSIHHFLQGFVPPLVDPPAE